MHRIDHRGFDHHFYGLWVIKAFFLFFLDQEIRKKKLLSFSRPVYVQQPLDLTIHYLLIGNGMIIPCMIFGMYILTWRVLPQVRKMIREHTGVGEPKNIRFSSTIKFIYGQLVLEGLNVIGALIVFIWRLVIQIQDAGYKKKIGSFFFGPNQKKTHLFFLPPM